MLKPPLLGVLLTMFFGFRILGVNTLEEVIGHGMMALLIFTFYEHFFSSEELQPDITRSGLFALLTGLVGLLTILVVDNYYPSILLSLEFPYLLIGTIAILPLIYAISRNPDDIREYAYTTVYFFILFFSIELFAVYFDYWIYPGDNYIGYVSISGLKYPFEELFFWMILYAPTLIAYYKYTMEKRYVVSF
jgi:hypothetical protein